MSTLEGGPSELVAELTRVNHLLTRGDAKGAVERCQVLLKRFPASVDVMRGLGLGYLQQQQLTEAEKYLSRALRAAPTSPDLLNEIGIIRLKQNAYDQAVGLFARALEIDPAHSDALNNVSDTFTILQQPAKARPYLERLIRVAPFSAPVHVKAADNSLALDNVDEAIHRARKAVRLAPSDSLARLSLADALEAAGRFTQAKFQYLSVLRRDPRQITALSRILALKGTHLSDHYARQAQQILDGNQTSDGERVQLHLGLARYFDQRRQYGEAFGHAQAGNSIRSRNCEFDSAAFSRAVDRIITVFTAEFLASRIAQADRNKRPIFIVGMPRSGTTLVEQILASHSLVQPGGELSTIISIAAQIGSGGRTYPEGVPELHQDEWSRLAQLYLDRLNALYPDAAHVTDKMPFNFMHVGLLVSLFPDAKIVHCRREAMDTCLSCFFTTFSEQLQFTSDLTALGRYYLDYRRLMAHWRAALPRLWLELQYENLVVDTERTVRKLLNFCDLAWEPACVQFYQTERAVRTPSRWQVRQPIYAHSVGRWRNYERQLQPLKEILQPVLREDAQRMGMLS